MNRRYYGQFGEDFLLWSLFGERQHGYYVDVGAFDGLFLSNTYSFEEQGWQGICVEAHPTYYDLCRLARPGSICLHAACVAPAADRTVAYYADELGLFSGVLGGREPELKNRYAGLGLTFQGFARPQVPAITLDAILASYLPPGTAIDFVSIDVEGSELDVLRGFDLERYRPRVLLVEANTQAAGDRLSHYLARHGGYRLVRRLGVNMVHVHARSDLRYLYRVVVDCAIQPQEHPSGARYKKLSGLQHSHVYSKMPNRIVWHVRRAMRRGIRFMRKLQKQAGFRFKDVAAMLRG